VRSLATITLLLAGTVTAGAEPCVALSGDEALVTAVHDLLATRGIDVSATCHEMHASLTRRGDAFVVGIDAPDGLPVERTVNEVGTAATVIESWVRTDVAAPLLETHIVPREIDPLLPPPPVVKLPPTKHVVHLFAAAETSLGSDRTEWYGAQAGACVMLGPICAAARMRVASVGEGPGHWGGNLQREGVEILIGVDLPFKLHRFTLTPGFGTGFGATHTHVEGLMHIGSESSGLRADAHITFSFPITRHVAIDLSLTGNLTQESDIESSDAPTVRLPDEPRALIRIGAGVRYLGRLDEDAL